MKKLTLFSIVALLLSVVSFAQSVIPCGFDAKHKERMLKDHSYEAGVRAVDTRWIKYSSLMSTALLTYTPKGYVYEVPMVIHILHTGGAPGSPYNPSDATIAGMVDYLNKSYAAVSPFPDTTAGGCRIPLKFVLAKRTPGGASTTGIIRLDASGIPNYTTYGANASTSAGVDDADIMAFSRWNPSDYYNVYVVNKIDGNDLYTTGGIAGFAYYPGSPTLDGMIVAASQAKSGSTTISHEFGHAFSLRHTFEDDANGTACPPTGPCATTGDLVCDTEPHIRSASSPGWCPATDANPCTGGASYKNVQNNIMDYTNCPPNRYTAGQRLRVLNVLDNERTGYKSSLGLSDPTGTVIAACVPTSTGTTGNAGPFIVDFNGNEVWTGDLGMENSAYVDHSYTQQSYVVKGGVYPINITTRTNRQKVKVYIDYNSDGDFADAGEEVFSNVGATSGTIVHSGNITIPTTGVTTCTWLRVRVVAALNSATITDMACGPYANNAQAEDYGVYVKDRTAVDTVTIAQTAGTNPSCTGSSVTFVATPKGGTPTYRWYINGAATANTTNTYTSSTLANNDIITCKTYYTGACGSDSAVSNMIQLKVNSTALAVAKNTLITGTNPGCPGQSLVFKALVSGGGSAPVYSWRKNGTVVGTDDTFASSTLVAGDKIWCRVTPNSTCSTTPVNSDTITIAFATVVPDVTISLTSGAIPSCDSTSLTFATATKNGGPAPTYQWFVNSVAVSGATMNFYTEPMLKNNDTVSCRVISNHPCIVAGVGDTAWSNKIIVIRDPRFKPTLSVSMTRGSNPGCLDSLVEFTAVATDGGGSPVIAWYVNGALTSYGSVFGSTAFLNNDTVTCKMFVTPASCNSVDSLMWGPEVMVRSLTPGTPIISLIGTMLVSSIPTDIQWYGPSGLIPGATGPTYHPTTEGSYYAVVVNAGCNGKPSNVLNVSLLGISPYNMNEVRIYPNPSTGILTLDWGTEKVSADIDVFTVTGQRVVNVSVDKQSKQTLNLTQLANGNYFVVIRDNNGKTGTVSIVVKH